MEQENKIPTILVAEDNNSNYLLISTILKKDYQMIHAENGEIAVRLYKEMQPNLILMDIKMPVMDGLEATRLIREIDQSIPIIAVTAFAFDSDKEKTLAAGCNEYITKPINIKELKSVVAKYFENSL